MFCARCGREPPLVGPLCGPCFLATTPFATLPPVVQVEVCGACGAPRRGASWGAPLPSEAVAVEEGVAGALALHGSVERWSLGLEEERRAPAVLHLVAVVRGTAHGLPFEARAPVEVRVRRGTCTRCGRLAGGAYEGVLQLRAEGRDLGGEERREAEALVDRALEALRAAGDLDSVLVKVEEVRGGVDAYLGTAHAARVAGRALAEQLGAALQETASLVGRRRDGTDLCRVTVCAKLPRAPAGAFAGLGDRLYLVASVGPKRATLTDLAEHRRVTRARGELGAAEVLPGSAAREAVVVSERERELQVLDPESLRTVEVARPPGFPQGRGSVRVVRWRERLWLLPEEPGR